MKHKGFLWLLLAGLMLMSSVAVQADDFTYTTNSDNTITITGYTGPGGAVIIPAEIDVLPVMSIGELAFDSCTNLTSVVISEGITGIGNGAFYSCSGLTNITIADSVTNLGIWAFYNCSELTAVQIGNRVADIGDCTFKSCVRLTSILIPDSVANIGEEAFSECESLGSVQIGGGVVRIGPWAFLDCTGLYSIKIPNSVVRIDQLAFCNCRVLQHVEIGSGLTSFGIDVFYNCNNVDVYFFGDAPSLDGTPLFGSNSEYPQTSKSYCPDDATGWPMVLGLWAGRPLFPWQPDSDLDNIPDYWEKTYFGGVTNANANSFCSNGINTVLEAYIAGLDPASPAAHFNLTFPTRNILQWNAVSGRVYSVYWSTNLLAGFQCLQSNIPWSECSLTNPTAAPSGYYKITVRMAP